MKKTLLAVASAAVLIAASISAYGGNTVFLTDRNGQITFPISPPNRANSTPGAIDNMTIGATTPAAGTFTLISTGGQACNADPCTEQGLNAAQGGALKNVGGTSSTSANAGGAASLIGGTPGATGVGGAATVTGGIGGSTSGSGGAANVTGGAGTAGNANGGSAVLSGGAPNGTGVAGSVRELGLVLRAQPTPGVLNATGTLTAAQLISRIITSTAAAAVSATLPLATAMDTAIPDSAANDSFDFAVIDTNGANAVTILTATGWTLVGSMVVTPVATGGSGQFRATKTGAGAWVLYRLS